MCCLLTPSGVRAMMTMRCCVRCTIAAALLQAGAQLQQTAENNDAATNAMYLAISSASAQSTRVFRRHFARR
jgi:hypothetical protein